MLLSFLGVRGTIPTADSPTVSFLINNKILFEPIPEIIQSLQKYSQKWRKMTKTDNFEEFDSPLLQYASPSVSKLEYVIISHLHWDHWGGLRHILHYISLIDREMRKENKLKIVIPHKSAEFLATNLARILGVNRDFFPDSSANILKMWMVIELGSIILDLVEFIEISPNKPVTIDKELTLHCSYNSHLLGSVSYKLIKSKTKLRVKKAKRLGIPFDKTLSSLLKKQEMNINGRIVKSTDIFYDEKISISYSGDTPIDDNLKKFFNNSEILIHDSTYLKEDESYHLDVHSSLPKIIEFMKNINIDYLIPVHFSYRYTKEEIFKMVNDVTTQLEPPYGVITPYSETILLWDKNQKKLIEITDSNII